jgi:hypothetical protein
MADIFHNFPIKATSNKVFEAIISSEGLDKWWTKSSEVNPRLVGTYAFDFGPGYIWKAVVSKFIKEKAFEIKMTEADTDWLASMFECLRATAHLRQKRCMEILSFPLIL